MTTATIVKAPRFRCERCERCGLWGPSPIVVSTNKKYGDVPLGRCSNVKACQRRQQIAAVTKSRPAR